MRILTISWKNFPVLIRFVLRSMSELGARIGLFIHLDPRCTKKVAGRFARFVCVPCEKTRLKWTAGLFSIARWRNDQILPTSDEKFKVKCIFFMVFSSTPSKTYEKYPKMHFAPCRFFIKSSCGKKMCSGQSTCIRPMCSYICIVSLNTAATMDFF